MGCGSSKPTSKLLDAALASHIAAAIGIAAEYPEIQQYVSALRSEGWDTPEDFDDLSLDELKREPFCFKPGHLKKVARSRTKGGVPVPPAIAEADNADATAATASRKRETFLPRFCSRTLMDCVAPPSTIHQCPLDAVALCFC